MVEEAKSLIERSLREDPDMRRLAIEYINTIQQRYMDGKPRDGSEYLQNLCVMLCSSAGGYKRLADKLKILLDPYVAACHPLDQYIEDGVMTQELGDYYDFYSHI